MANLKYDTVEKRKKFIKKEGSIITFKEPFFPRGTSEPSKTQIIVQGFEGRGNKPVKIIGFAYDSPWFDNIDKLIEAIDWDKMEAWHKKD